MFRHLRVHQIFGANTEVGKTLFATALCRASVNAGEVSHYLKPVGTGGHGDDAHISTFSKNTKVACLYRFDEPVSPHLAAQRTQKKDGNYRPPSDAQFVTSLKEHLDVTAKSNRNVRSSLFVETAGGVHSPTLSATTQAEAYRPLRLPTVLVASPHLGGISTTLSSYESLLLRGYTIDALACLKEDYYQNWQYFEKWCEERGLAFATMERPPLQVGSRQQDQHQMEDYYSVQTDPARGQSTGSLPWLIQELHGRHLQRIAELEAAASKARSSYWYPFVQHDHIKSDKDIMVIDSAHQDCLEVFSQDTDDYQDSSQLISTFDGSASWWTQCLGHGNTDLTLAAANAAGRYGHLIFPMATHEPALELSERLLETVGKGWADRVFFSDDGSTGMEVALKMALKTSARAVKDQNAQEPIEMSVLGMRGSYHGDTIGVMDASEPSVYNKSVEWYRGRGFWLDVPTVQIRNGKIVLDVPVEAWEAPAPPEETFETLAAFYDVERRLQSGDRLYQYYHDNIDRLVKAAIKEHNLKFGTLVIEPLVIGAGGMLFVDPVFQRALVDYARAAFETPLPVIYDEVFVGLYRLGLQSSSDCLGVKPDIACYAKILTGGLVPMAVTLSNKRIYNTFLGAKKEDALLHGHSYTAHPVGCAVANRALDLLEQTVKKGTTWADSRAAWTNQVMPSQSEEGFFSLWEPSFIYNVSRLNDVESVMTMGTVLKISLIDRENAGYQSTASAEFLRKLRHPTAGGLPVHARPLGNTVYWMSSVNTPQATLQAVQEAIIEALKS